MMIGMCLMGMNANMQYKKYEAIGVRDHFKQESDNADYKQVKFNIYKQFKPYIGVTFSKAFVMKQVAPLTEHDIIIMEAEDHHDKESLYTSGDMIEFIVRGIRIVGEFISYDKDNSTITLKKTDGHIKCDIGSELTINISHRHKLVV